MTKASEEQCSIPRAFRSRRGRKVTLKTGDGDILRGCWESCLQDSRWKTNCSQSAENKRLKMFGHKWNVYITPLPKTQGLAQNRGRGRVKPKWKTGVNQCLLDMTGSLDSWTHCSCGCLHNIPRINIPPWNGRDLWAPHPYLRSYRTADGFWGVGGYGHWQVDHTPIDCPTPIQTAQTGVSVFERKEEIKLEA